jgi:Protein tyrosine kinase.
MSNFKHEHILRLIGVCLDNNPTLIIMELMEGKDLLSYLRSHRPTKVNVAILLKILNGGTSVASENPKSPISAPQKKSFYVRGILEQEVNKKNKYTGWSQSVSPDLVIFH